MIWHCTSTHGIHSSMIERSDCPFCRGKLEEIGRVSPDGGLDVTELDSNNSWVSVYACSACGWWKMDGQIEACFGPEDPLTPNKFSQREVLATAALANLDITDDTVPIDDVRRYLIARAKSGKVLHPKLLEETVASVFRSIGFQARVTAYSGDEGIDVILDGPEGKTIGVQVKRYQDKIKADHIRSFVGALILEGHCGGIFVTTSDFQRGSYVAADKASVMGLPVSLITGKKFEQALRLTNMASFNGYNLDEPPFSDTKVFTVCYRPERCSGKYTYVWGSDTRAKRNA